MQIFSWIGYVFGYLLWAFYELTKNYGIAIILFTIVLKIITFPFSVKQQKSMAQNARLANKQRELKEKYGNDKVKLSEETQKLCGNLAADKHPAPGQRQRTGRHRDAGAGARRFRRV